MAGPVGAIATVSVVVPTVGRVHLADVVVGALADPATREVVVVVDRHRSATDTVLAAAGLAGDPRVTVLDGPGLGAASARQHGIERATGEIVLLLDDDVVPEPGLVSAHRVAHAAASTALVGVGPMPVAPALRAGDAVARLYSNDYDAEWARQSGAPAAVLPDLWGGNVSLRRTDALAVPQAGDVGVLHDREDQEWGLRAAVSGLRGEQVPDARAVHWHQATAAQMLGDAAGQARAARLLAGWYPELTVVPDPTAGLPRPVRWLVACSTAPVLGRALRAVTVATARRVGDGRPSRTRLGLLVIARAMIQRRV